MGVSKLGIMVKDIRSPCTPYHSTGHWFLADIFHCDPRIPFTPGDPSIPPTPLTWNGTTFIGYRLRGRIHDQIEVPPGCYLIRARAKCGNVVTQLAFVEVGCEETKCVTLIPTTVQYCLTATMAGLMQIITDPPGEKALQEKCRHAIDAIKEVAALLPKDVFPEISLKELAELEKKVQEKKEK